MIEYIKGKWLEIVVFFAMILFLDVVLQVFIDNNIAVFFILIIIISFFVVFFAIDAFSRVRYTHRIEKILEQIEQKHLIGEIIEDGSTFETQKLKEFLRVITKYLNELIASHNRYNQEYREYVEIWVHEIKTPIASSLLLIENNPNEISDSLKEELSKIDNYINQALFYARSNSVEKDYVITECNLGQEIRKIIKEKSQDFIIHGIKLEMDNLDYSIFTDNKWLEFILGQIFDNAIKYMDKDQKKIRISAIENTNSISLLIIDNGMGIDSKDIDKVFEKGYVGVHGRAFARSTGIGLYLCKKLCDQLMLGLEISSVDQEGTTVKLSFPKSKYSLLEG